MLLFYHLAKFWCIEDTRLSALAAILQRPISSGHPELQHTTIANTTTITNSTTIYTTTITTTSHTTTTITITITIIS